MEMARDFAGASRPSAKPAPKAARTWWKVHQWVGLKLSLFMTFILFTGTLAVVSAEIDWLLQPSLRVAPSSVEGPVAWAEIAENAAAYPGVAEATYINAPTASAFAAKVTVEDIEGNTFFLHAHPTTGEIQGTGPWVGAHRVLRNMHRHLNLPVWLGVPIVSSLAILLLISLVTSFVVYKKWWRGFRKPLRNRDARTWWGDFHRLAGVWSLWFVALITLTSLWYLVESLGGDAPAHPRVERGNVASDAEPADRSDLGAAIDAALAASPGLEVESVRLPSSDNLLQIDGNFEAVLVRPRSNAVHVDARTAEVLLKTDGRDLNLHQRIGEMADPLHFGYFGGYWTKVPWFLFGLALTGLSLSGAAIYSLRIARERGDQVKISRSFSGMWQGMGRWRWLSVTSLTTALIFLILLVLGMQ
ncbi:PepSY-associated TM helix domain-containing protein [Aurantiacibacter odishensis]|uniref:PepSY-associated TM helix domain-containing protein n=1 Tax=Aurantiacibacter odishensis TaxID=1155476 RepID=UPI001F0BC89B|nr:PepSY-associated TM helix domain-containing protein [Aurantiacibacter odishensis]